MLLRTLLCRDLSGLPYTDKDPDLLVVLPASDVLCARRALMELLPPQTSEGKDQAYRLLAHCSTAYIRHTRQQQCLQWQMGLRLNKSLLEPHHVRHLCVWLLSGRGY